MSLLRIILSSLLVLLTSIHVAGLYYVLLPPFELAVNASFELQPESLEPFSSELTAAVAEHLSMSAANWTTDFLDIILKASPRRLSSGSLVSGAFVFSGHAIFEGDSGADPWTSADLHDRLLRPALLADAGSAQLDARLQAFITNFTGFAVLIQEKSTLVDPKFYYLSLPAFDVSLKHRNVGMDDTAKLQSVLEDQVKQHLESTFRNKSVSVSDSLFDIYLQGEMQSQPFDALSSLYWVNYTETVAVFIDTVPSRNHSIDSVFEDMIPEAFLRQYGYFSLVQRLNQTEAWNGLQGLKISVDNPYYDPDWTSDGSSRLVTNWNLWYTAQLVLVVVSFGVSQSEGFL